MADGLPIPKERVLPTSGNVIGAGAYSGAQSWLNIADAARTEAAAAEKIAQAGGALAEKGSEFARAEQRRAELKQIADFEVDWRAKKNEARDRFMLDPEGFRTWAKESTEGALQNVPGWMVPHAKQFLSREFEGAGNAIMAERRADDKRLESQSLTARIKMADDDVMSIASSTGSLNNPEGKAALATYKGILDSAAATRLISGDQAQLLTEDLTTRGQGALIRKSVEGVYRDKGFEAARDHLDQRLSEFGTQYRITDKIRTQTLSWLRSEEAGLRGERDAVAKEWSAAKAQIETLPRDVLIELQQKAYSLGAIKTGDDIQAHVVASDTLREIRKLPIKDQMRILASGDFEARLVNRENASKDPRTLNEFGFVGNYQFGAPRLQTLGLYKPGDNENLGAWSKTPANATGKWSGTFSIPGFPDVKTLEDFRNSPGAQKAAFDVHQKRTDFEIEKFGLGRYVGETVGGVPITRDGLRGMIHLAGAEGARRTLESGGAFNPADDNGVTALDYARLGDPGASAGKLTATRAGLLTLGLVRKDLAKDLDAKITAMQSDIQKTEFPPMEEIGHLVAQVNALGTPEQKRKVAEMRAQAEFGKGFQSLPKAQRDELVAAVQEKIKNGGTQFDRDLAEIVKKADQNISAEWTKDPYAAGARYVEGIPALPAIDWSAPSARDVLTAKAQLQNTIRADQGMGPFSVLRAGEAQQLAQVLVNGDPRQGSAILRMMGEALPADMYKATIADAPIKAALDGMVRSYDPDRLNTAMSVLDQAYRADPVGFKTTFGDDTLRRLQTWQGKKDFTPPIAMAEHFKRADDPAFAAARKKLEEEADKKLGEMTTKAVANELGSFFDRNVPFVNQAPPVDPIAAKALAGEYDVLFRERYVDNAGDVTKAKEQTVERLKTIWGPSVVAGGALMRHPPEKSPFYPQVNGSHDWMKKDLEDSIQASRLGADEEYDPSTGTGPNYSYRLISDARTDADVAARRPPSYVVMIKDIPSGRDTVPLDWQGRPMRFQFDPANAQREARESFMTTRVANEAVGRVEIGDTPEQRAAIMARATEEVRGRNRLINEGIIVPGGGR